MISFIKKRIERKKKLLSQTKTDADSQIYTTSDAPANDGSAETEQSKNGLFMSGTWVPAGHFYSPIADVDLIRANAPRIFSATGDLPGITIDFESFRKRFAEFQEVVTRLDLPETETPRRRYFFQNPAFSYGDAVTYSWILSKTRPAQVIEVGSGYSSCLLLDLRDLLNLSEMKISFIEPYPELLLRLLKDENPSYCRIIAKSVQEIDTSVFEVLEADDILFIDSTHVSKIDSDVNHHLFRILPCLRSGVLIHFHDIFYPFEYPREWIFEENRSWNENYILRAFLMYNQEYEIIFFNSAFESIAGEAERESCPTFFKNSGGSIWLRKL